MLKIPSKYEQRYFVRKNSFSSAVPPALLLDGSVGRIAKELFLTNQELRPLILFAQDSQAGWPQFRGLGLPH
jgi:hypothetical protein